MPGLVIVPMIAARAGLSRFNRPKHVRHSDRPVRVIPFVRRAAAIGRLADKLAPIIRIVAIIRRWTRRARAFSSGSICAVEVTAARARMRSGGERRTAVGRVVNAQQLIVVALVGVGAVGAESVLARI